MVRRDLFDRNPEVFEELSRRIFEWRALLAEEVRSIDTQLATRPPDGSDGYREWRHRAEKARGHILYRLVEVKALQRERREGATRERVADSSVRCGQSAGSPTRCCSTATDWTASWRSAPTRCIPSSSSQPCGSQIWRCLLADRWWHWAFITALTVFAAGYAAARYASDPAMFIAVLPFCTAGIVYGSLETRRLVRDDRARAISAASRVAARVERMGPIT